MPPFGSAGVTIVVVETIGRGGSHSPTEKSGLVDPLLWATTVEGSSTVQAHDPKGPARYVKTSEICRSGFYRVLIRFPRQLS